MPETLPSAVKSKCMLEIGKITLVFLLSTVKFAFGISAALANGFGFWQMLFTTALGGSAGVLLFFLFGKKLFAFLRKKGIIKTKKKQRIFSRNKRRLVRIKNTYGITGIALLTPVVLSIPVGCLLVARYFPYQRNALLVLLAAVWFWAVSLSLFSFLYA